ncbi:MAG: hypothetical protein KHZ62_03665 [Clostridiales bacterium]|nr:hypothetical protein [Clostridiales bacterium]
MKSAKLFLFGMYMHLVLSIAVPVGILHWCIKGWNAVGIGLFFLYLATAILIQIEGWVCVGSAVAAYRLNRIHQLRASLKQLKLYSIPFYLFNFIYSFFVWFILIGSSRGILFFLVPIPIFFTCLMIVQSGCIGICYIRYLRQQTDNRKKPSIVHYILQLISIFDVFSTIYLLINFKEESCTPLTLTDDPERLENESKEGGI